ncbi:kinase-like domain-containing protein [Rhizophagus clarus]|uniref:Kinase-like domain-containing protein n=1 Tax=Rhizophagus clarus TaxID=94130 RepID=A0A8H3LRW7_9GLOM|nr:kinase-like domain-containing protein [Rhizophagus clarus]
MNHMIRNYANCTGYKEAIDSDTPSNPILYTNCQNFTKIDMVEIKPKAQNIHDIVFEEELGIVIDELINLYGKELIKE